MLVPAIFNKPPKKYPNQQGTVLISVLLLFAIGSFIAIEITYRQQIDIKRTLTVFSVSQAKEYVSGAEQIARYGLAQDLKSDNSQADKMDHDSETWGMALSQPVEGGLIVGKLSDLQGRFNLNWLATTEKARLQDRKKAFINLLSQLKIPKKGTPQGIADQLVDWLDEDSTPIFPEGKEDQEYMIEPLPRRSGNRLLTEVSELLILPAMTLEDLELLAPYVTVLPPKVGLNLNSVSEIVLGSFECVAANTVVNSRPPKGYLKVSDAMRFKKDGNCSKAKEGFPVPYDVRSEFFQLEAASEVNGKTVKVKSILYRDNTQNSKIDVKVIYRRQVDRFSKI